MNMTKLPNKEFRAMVPLLREKDFYEPEEKRQIIGDAFRAVGETGAIGEIKQNQSGRRRLNKLKKHLSLYTT